MDEKSKWVEEDAAVYFARLTVALEIRRTHGLRYSAAFLREFAAQIRTAAILSKNMRKGNER